MITTYGSLEGDNPFCFAEFSESSHYASRWLKARSEEGARNGTWDHETAAPNLFAVRSNPHEFDQSNFVLVNPLPLEEAQSSSHDHGEASRFMEVTTDPTMQTVGYETDDFTGKDQVIIVIDDGYSIDYDQSATVFEYDYSGYWNDNSALTRGLDSHGSWVGQTALAEAEDATIVHLKVFPDDEPGASLYDIEEALNFVIDNADVADIAAVNLSLGFGNAVDETVTMLSDEFAALDDLGIFSVVAAGNNGEEYEDGVNILAADPNVIGVSAVDAFGAFADFSQTHASLTDIAALGVGVPVETIWGQTGYLSGTSFSAPTISGIAARLQEASLAVNGHDLSDDEFVFILQQSGTPVTGETAVNAGFTVADGDAAVQYFLEHALDFSLPDDILIA